jgi:hypothetical protein
MPPLDLNGRHLVSFDRFFFVPNNPYLSGYQLSQLSQLDKTFLYDKYKLSFADRYFRLFFEHFKNEEWFQELYHPVCLRKRLEEKSTIVKRSQALFFSALENGTPIMYRVFECPPSQRCMNPKAVPVILPGSFVPRPVIIPRNDFDNLGDDPESFFLAIISFFFLIFTQHTLSLFLWFSLAGSHA